MADPAVIHWHSARLTMRALCLDDLDFLAGLFALPALTAHRPDPRPDHRESVAANLARDLDHWARHGHGRWRIADAEGNVGVGGLTRRAGEHGLNLSYHLHPDAWGRGYASEFGAGAVAIAFGALAAPAVIGFARPGNPASQAVLRRLGFCQLGAVEMAGAPTLRFELARHPSGGD